MIGEPVQLVVLPENWRKLKIVNWIVDTINSQNRKCMRRFFCWAIKNGYMLNSKDCIIFCYDFSSLYKNYMYKANRSKSLDMVGSLIVALL